MKSRGHCSGFVMIATQARPWLRKVLYESALEKHFALIVATQNDVYDIVEQPRAVSFTKACGTPARHTFDFLVEYTDGLRVAVAIKPWERVERMNFRATLERIADATPKSFADKVTLITDQDAARSAARELMLRNRSLMEATE